MKTKTVKNILTWLAAFAGVTGMCAQADVAADGPMGVERVRHGVVLVKTAPKP